MLNRIEEVHREIEKTNRADISVGKVISITDILKEIHQAINENDKAFYRIPQHRDVIAQEFLLFENSRADDLSRIVDSQFKKTRITVKTSWVDALVCKDFIKDISSGGVFIKTNMPFSVGQDVSLAFQIPKQQEHIKMTGKIVRITDEGIGVKFKIANENQGAMIKTLMEVV